MTLGTGERERAHKAIVPIVERDECNKPWIMNDSVKENTMFCAGHLIGGMDACKGDSGGPAIALHNGRFVVQWTASKILKINHFCKKSLILHFIVVLHLRFQNSQCKINDSDFIEAFAHLIG